MSVKPISHKGRSFDPTIDALKKRCQSFELTIAEKQQHIIELAVKLVEARKISKRYLWLQCQDNETWQKLSAMKTRTEMDEFIDEKLSTIASAKVNE